MKSIEVTYEEWAEHTSDVLWEEAKRQELDHVDELDPNVVLYIRHRMCEEWINYKLRSGKLRVS